MGAARVLAASHALPSIVYRVRPQSRTFPTFRDFLKLSKYRLSALVSLTAVCGYTLRTTEDDMKVAILEGGSVGLGTFLAAAGANTFNQVYEVASDSKMRRTWGRPLVRGRISLMGASLFGGVVSAMGVGLLSYCNNSTAAGLAAANIGLYAGVYTPLKAISTVNTWVGAVVGAIPPMLGWAAASDGKLDVRDEAGAWALGGLLFLWQIPHFHALATMARKDYAAGGLKMLAVVDPAKNAIWATLVSGWMVPIGWVFWMAQVTNGWFIPEAAALGMWMYTASGRMLSRPAHAAAGRPLFKASITYLPVVMGCMVFHKADQKMQSELYRNGKVGRQTQFYYPWEEIAPFPFLPVPRGPPAYVQRTSETTQ